MERMPPANKPPFDPVDHLLPPAHKSSVGPIVGTVIILALLVIGGLYFWGASLNRVNPADNVPLIPGDIADGAVR